MDRKQSAMLLDDRQELHQFSFTDRIAIRRIGLEAGKPFVDELAQFSQDLIIDVLDDAMEAIVDRTGCRQFFILFKRIAQGTAGRPKGHMVQDGRRAAAGRRNAAAVKVITGAILRRLLQGHMGMSIDAARADIETISVDDCFMAIVDSLSQGLDLSLPDGDVSPEMFPFQADRPVFDDVIHGFPFFLYSISK